MKKISKFFKNIFFKKSSNKKKDEIVNENIESLSQISSQLIQRKLSQVIPLSTLSLQLPVAVPIQIVSSSLESYDSNYKITFENIKPYNYYNRCEICNRQNYLNECDICKDLFCQRCDIVFNGYCNFCKY